MSPLALFQNACLLAFVALLFVAAWQDLRTLRIANGLPLAILGIYAAWAAGGITLGGLPATSIGFAILTALVIFALGAAGFAGGILGGGDVKLLTASMLGVALDMQGRHDEAQANYRHAIELAPQYLPARSNFGLSLAITGPAQEAVAQLASIATAHGSDARIRQNLVFAYVMAGDFENALQLSRHDLDERSAQRQLSYYIQLRTLSVEQRSLEVRRNPSFMPQTAG